MVVSRGFGEQFWEVPRDRYRTNGAMRMWDSER